MEKETEKNEYITRKDLEEQAQSIVTAVDAVLSKRLEPVTSRLDGIDVRLTGTDVRFNGIINRLDEMESGLGEKIDSNQALIDGYVKAQEPACR